MDFLAYMDEKAEIVPSRTKGKSRHIRMSKNRVRAGSRQFEQALGRQIVRVWPSN